MKKGSARRAPLIVLVALAFSLAGCDSFSLTDRLTLPDSGAAAPLSLTAEKASTLRNGAVGLLPVGGTEPYAFAVSAFDLFSGTKEGGLGSVSSLTYVAGGAIGKIKVTVSDSKKATASTYIAVLPDAPTLSSACARGGDNRSAGLSWTYSDVSTIDKYRLERSVDGEAYAPLGYLAAAAASYTDAALTATSAYNYRLYAVSGTYESAPAYVSLPPASVAPLSLATDKAAAPRLVGTVGLTPSGGVKPYSFAVSAFDLYNGTQTAGIGSVSGLSYVAGGAIGKIRITVSDAEGSTAFAYVTVLPPTPTLTGSRTGGGGTVSLSWAYSENAIIDKFRLEYSVDGGAYASLDEPTSTQTSHDPINNLAATSTYSYRLYAISGSYESAPAVISFAR